jgi:hypothetical protein
MFILEKVCYRHVDLHWIVTMTGFHAVTLWQMKPFIVAITWISSCRISMGKTEANCRVNFVAEELTILPSQWRFVSVFPPSVFSSHFGGDYPQHKLAYNHPLDITWCFEWQRASSCIGKNPKMIDWVGCLLSSCWFAFDCDSDGCHAQNCGKMKHFIVAIEWILSSWFTNGKEGRKLSSQLCCRGAYYFAIEMNLCVCLSLSWHWNWWKEILATRPLAPTINPYNCMTYG